MNNLATAYQAAGRKTEALELLEQTLELRRAKFGFEHPDTLLSMNNVAFAYNSAGRMAEALPLYEQALELTRRQLGPAHPNTLKSLNNLAEAYHSDGQLDRAIPLLIETLDFMQTKLGPEHPTTLTTTHSLADAYLAANRFDKALPLMRTFVDGGRRLAKDEVSFGTLLATVSLDLLKYQQSAAAEQYLRECLDIRHQKLPDDWSLFNTKSMLGGALAGQKKFDDAEPLLIDGYEGMKARQDKIPAAAKVRLKEALQRLVDLYTSWEKPDEAAKWMSVLDAATSASKE
jgi:tetratricopeptide (TPR) repeat protein